MNPKPIYANQLIIDLRSAGDFGSIKMSDIFYSKDQLEEIGDDIIKHHPEVNGYEIVIDGYECGKCSRGWETKEEAERCCQSR